MSEDETIEKKENPEKVEKKKQKRIEDDRSTPEAIDSAFTLWLVSLFRDNERANVVTVQQLFGRHGRTLGEIIKRHYFPTEKPTTEYLVAVSNELFSEMQNEADTFRKPMLYAITAYNSKKGGGDGTSDRAGGGGFARRTMEVTPKTVRLTLHGEDGDDDDENPLSSGDMLRKRAETVLQDGRFYAEHVSTTFGGFMELTLDLIKELRADSREARAAWLEATKARNEAENNALDRELARMERQIWVDVKKKGVNFLFGSALPAAQDAVMGAITGKKTDEAATIERVINENLDESDRDRIFGKWSDDGRCMRMGILTESQVRIVVAVKDGKVSVDDLDGLISGSNAITVEQANALQADLEKVMPFLIILKKRKEKIEAAQAAAK